MNDAEQEILDFGVPPAKYQQMLADIEAVARDNCDATVPAGWDHNCYIVEGADASTPHYNPPVYFGGIGECIGSCSFINPPPNGSCPELNPYQCESEASAADDVGTDDEPGPIEIDIDAVVCDKNTCAIDRTVAQAVLTDPLRYDPHVRLIYDGTRARFTIHGVESGSLAERLGLRTSDVIESVDDVVIDGFDTALVAYSSHAEASRVTLRILRGETWIDFVYLLQ